MRAGLGLLGENTTGRNDHQEHGGSKWLHTQSPLSYCAVSNSASSLGLETVVARFQLDEPLCSGAAFVVTDPFALAAT